jgi:hypothetical protein
MSFTSAPVSPWASPCRRCGAEPPATDRPPSNSARLVAFVSARPTHHGGVVELSAALWGGHHTRTVTLDPHQARVVGRELLGLAAALDRDAQLDRRARRMAARDGSRPAPASERARRGAAAPTARPPVRPTAALESRR